MARRVLYGLGMSNTYREINSAESPIARRRVRTSIGMLTLARGRHSAGLVLSIAEGRARGTHTDSPLDGPALYAAIADQRETLAALCERHDLARIEVYAPASHGGCMVEDYEIAE